MMVPVTGATGRRVGRPARVDRQMIVEAAIAVGFDHLTMPAVGRHLGVSHATLYSHVKDREELLLAAVDGVLSGQQWPQYEGDWRDFLSRFALQLWELFDSHRGLAYAMEATGSSGLPDHYADLLRQVRGSLVDAGFRPEDAITVTSMVIDHAVAFYKGGKSSDGESLSVLELRHPAPRPPAQLRGVDDRLRQALADIIATPPREWFLRRLRIILDGAERLLTR